MRRTEGDPPQPRALILSQVSRFAGKPRCFPMESHTGICYNNPMAKQKDNGVPYDENAILSLDSLEHIRLRPGMYVGRLGDGTHADDGIYILLKEIIDNAVDEFTMHCGNRINVTLRDNCVTVRDFGRGIPFGKVVDCVSKINTGAKYGGEVFMFSVGLNGVGTKAVNALSSFFRVTSFRDGAGFEAEFEHGKLKSQKESPSAEPNGTLVEFIPDPAMFGDYHFNEEFIRTRMENYAFLNTGLTLTFNKQVFKSANGLMDLLQQQVGEDSIYPIISYKSPQLEFAFTHVRNTWGENYFSYVNGQHTSDGGTHLSAFKEGLLKGINEHSGKNWSPQDVREGIVGAISIKILNPIFESQTKNKLGNVEIRGPITAQVKEAVTDHLFKHPETAQLLTQRIINNEKLRKELNEVKKGAKEAARKVAINIPKLRDCKYHLGQTKDPEQGEASMIFLTEGDSASGTITKTRDVLTQAVYGLRGKILNVCGKQKTEIYKNEELYNMMVALGIENGLDGLRYGKVVIATDADNDGFHIRNLLMTYFFSYFEDLILAGRLYILETPLFRVRNKSVTRYCYSEAERDSALGAIKGAEITRFKGLGEIDSKEFGNFIGQDMKLVQVQAQSMSDIRKKIEFYMGANTPERREFIMENLV